MYWEIVWLIVFGFLFVLNVDNYKKHVSEGRAGWAACALVSAVFCVVVGLVHAVALVEAIRA